MSKRNSPAGKAARRRERALAGFPAGEQAAVREALAAPDGRALAEAADQLAESVPQAVIQQAMTAQALAKGGPDACQVCGDSPAFAVRWESGNGGGRLCDDCTGIQQSMYGAATGDRLLRL